MEPIRQENTVVGTEVCVRVVKNRTAPPNREVHVDLMYDRGICPYGDLLDAALAEGVIERTPSGFRYGEYALGSSRETARKRIAASDGRREELLEEVREAYETADSPP